MRPKQAPAMNPESEKEAKRKSPARRIVLAVLSVLVLVIVLVLAYLFLLVGEPEEETKQTPVQTEAVVEGPMTPMEGIGEGSLTDMAPAFGDSVLYLAQGATLMKSRVNDTAFGGGYARIVTLSYQLPGGTDFEVLSLRPLSAAELLKQDGEYTLYGNRLYSLAGLNAARMSSDSQSVLFAQSETAVYAIVFPNGAEEEILPLLSYSALLPIS